MKKFLIGAVGLGIVLAAAPQAMAGGHHRGRHHDNDGLRLATGIVNLVKAVVAPTPVVVTPPPAVIQHPVVVQPAPVVVTPPPVVVHPRPVVVAPPKRPHHRPAPPPRHDNRGHRNNRGHRR